MNNTLLPPSASAWMRGAEAATAKLSGITVAIRTLWTPTACPVDLLPYLAWALSVDRWDKNWPAEKKIASIQQSYWLHRRKGTRGAVRYVVEDMGFSATFAEWFETGEPRGTFSMEVDVNDLGISEPTINEMERLIGITKPVSRHLSGITMITRTAGDIYYGIAVSEGDVISVWPAGYEPDMSIFYNGRQYFDGECVFTGNASDEN